MNYSLLELEVRLGPLQHTQTWTTALMTLFQGFTHLRPAWDKDGEEIHLSVLGKMEHSRKKDAMWVFNQSV